MIHKKIGHVKMTTIDLNDYQASAAKELIA
jgi:hypothetical protein